MLYYGTRKVIVRLVNDILSNNDIDIKSVSVAQLVKDERFSVNIISDNIDTVKEVVKQSFYGSHLTTSP